jgi:uncharacterized protein (TIGR02300 family)
VAKPELGTKRQCQSCGAKFYDLNRSPITCIKCGAEFHVAQAPRAAQAAAEEEPETPNPAEAELVPLETLDAEVSKDVAPDADIDVESDDDAEDTFLEADENEEDDVSGLIDGEIEDDEEA